MVVAFTVLLTIFGGVMVNSSSTTHPILTQASIQRYAYRALASGLNAYQTAINANPYLAACNSATNGDGPQCAGLTLQTWSQVPGHRLGNGDHPRVLQVRQPPGRSSSSTTRARSPTSRSRSSARPASRATTSTTPPSPSSPRRTAS